MTSKNSTVSFIRGIAIIGVVLTHMYVHFDALPQAIAKGLKIGQLGCQAFFVLSSYCLCLSLKDKGIILPFRFYRRRFWSLAPGYWSTIVINLIISFGSVLILGFNCLPSLDTKPLHIVINLLLLNGFAPFWGPMNSVVFGGWFVGTLVVLYILFPILYKIYFMPSSIWWTKYRRIVFPLSIFILCSALMIVSGLGQESFCEPASVKYFSFINQLPAFSLGFALFEIIEQPTKINMPILFCVTTAILAFVWFSEENYSYIAAPFLSGVSTVYLARSITINHMPDSKLLRGIMWMGDNSYSIFLSHTWIVYGGVYALKETIGLSFIGGNDIITLCVMTLLLLSTIIMVAILFNKWISFIKRRIS